MGKEESAEISQEEKNTSSLGITNIPVDYSFRKMKSFDEEIKGRPRTMRTGRPVPSTYDGKYLSNTLWLNNNSLESIQYFSRFVQNVIQFPDKLEWIDMSFNNIEDIHEELLSFHNLQILYLHGNCLNDFDEIAKLQPLKKLRNLTLHGCPIETQPFYRQHIVYLLPQLKNLDFSTVTPRETKGPAPPGVNVEK